MPIPPNISKTAKTGQTCKHITSEIHISQCRVSTKINSSLMLEMRFFFTFIILPVYLISSQEISQDVDPLHTEVWGPGLYPDKIVMPARYFYIHAVDEKQKRLTKSPGDVFTVDITGDSDDKSCSAWVNILDRKDGSFIVRYKVYNSCYNVQIHVKYKGIKVAGSPYAVSGPVHGDECDCPEKNFDLWSKQFGCESESNKFMYKNIIEDLKLFPAVNITSVRGEIKAKFNRPGSVSVCNYVVKNNQIHRKCYGQYVDFKTFMDEILLSLTRKVKLPDFEMFVNLGDWPLVSKKDADNSEYIFPMFSWCGSKDTYDIVMPTYDLTEAALQCMGRVTLDMLSVQGNSELPWEERIEKGFWRGRDSRLERLKLVSMSREHPDLLNASLTNFFFFRDQAEIYGPKVPHISFFKFFDYKYQVSVDGTVAAYRIPYLLGGGSLVLKQDSNYYEHFYPQLIPEAHYVPFKSDLSDLIEKIEWAKSHDSEAKNIAERGRQFADEHLTPQSIFCYHATLFKEWSKRLISPVKVLKKMDRVQKNQNAKNVKCDCERNRKSAGKDINENKSNAEKEEL